jgi:hypothetical protein
MDRHAGQRQWRDFEAYRELVLPPEQASGGFTLRTVLGVLFIALVLTPGALYLGLFGGGVLAGASPWLAALVFVELARRSFISLRRQEVFLLVYVAAALVSVDDGAFLEPLWRQYFVRSAAAVDSGVAALLPWWWVPAPESTALAERTLFHRDWLWPLAVLIAGTLVGRLAWFGSGYLWFRLASDYERLPFPTAPVAALASMALAEESGTEPRRGRWPVLGVGLVVGLVFGGVYVGLPAVTGYLGNRLSLLPAPFVDLTSQAGLWWPAAPLGITLHLGAVFAGMFLPFWLVLGEFCAAIGQLLAAPALYRAGLLPHWQVGMDAVHTQITAGIDFWRAFALGITLAVVAISVFQVVAQARGRGRQPNPGDGQSVDHACSHPGCNRRALARGRCRRHLQRGDIPLWLAVALMALAALYPLAMARTLFPAMLTTSALVAFTVLGFVYAPLASYLAGRLEGLAGREATLPHMDDAARVLSGYRGVEVWLVPLPGRTLGSQTDTFRAAELVGLRFTSMLQAELLLVPVVLLGTLVYWAYLWRLGPIPSENYPFAASVWPLRAMDQSILLSSTTAGRQLGPGSRVDGADLGPNESAWMPRALAPGQWWFWRVRATRDTDVADPAQRRYGPWSTVGSFATLDAAGLAPLRPAAADPARVGGLVPPETATVSSAIAAPGPPERGGDKSRMQDASTRVVGDSLASRVTHTQPALTGDSLNRLVAVAPAPPATASGTAAPVHRGPAEGGAVPGDAALLRASLPATQASAYALEFEVSPTSDFVVGQGQRSTDPSLFHATFWRDTRLAGDRRDDDGDGRADEELANGRDDDGDGNVDEDVAHPFGGRKWPAIACGAGVGLATYLGLAAAGWPLFLLWGTVQAAQSVPALILPQIIGALLGRFGLQRWYGEQEGRRRAMLLAIGFGIGLALVGTFCALLGFGLQAAASILS